MLQLKNITKDYKTGDWTVHALRGVDLAFRPSEFVSVLGHSGCGKTTLLNIIGGLDRYTSGDLIIGGRSTKDFTSADWDSYRNHSIGFVFQSYNLIPHQSVLSNVELALTLSGVSRSERRRRAAEALKKVGLGDQLHKKPNQMSGGQMQRVAIARALVNDPDILLADEPTGALDSETSVQIMELLKEIAADKLVIMVTHNPDLAERYSSRIIRLQDGVVTDDSAPYEGEPAAPAVKKTKKERKKEKTSMSFFTALALSFNNLMTKKTRTLLTSFAGSIGIIGIALILSVSAGVNAYIQSVEESTVTSYPITINETTVDMSSLIAGFMEQKEEDETVPEGVVRSNDVMVSMMKNTTQGFTTNDLRGFKAHLDQSDEIGAYVNDIKYSYKTNLNTYFVTKDENGDPLYRKTEKSYMSMLRDPDKVDMTGTQNANGGNTSSLSAMNTAAWVELVGDEERVRTQYTLVDEKGRFPENDNEVVLIVDGSNRVSDFVLYMLGIRDPQELRDYLAAAAEAVETGEENTMVIEPTSYTFEELYDFEFRVLPDSAYYDYDGESGRILAADEEKMNEKLADAATIRIVGIVKASDSSLSENAAGGIGYRHGLMASMIDAENNSETVTRQLAEDETNLLTGMPFSDTLYTKADLPALKAMMAADPSYAAYVSLLSDDQIVQYANDYFVSTKESVLAKLGYVDLAAPSSILLYPKDFEAKDNITALIKQYNAEQDEAHKITYTDTIGLLMSSVTTILNAISYVLIAFVAISLVVSSIMIGIITYISVLERTKEIGILRAIGASKRDISRVFNAETLTVGFIAGAIGIGATLLLILLVNLILHRLTGLMTLSAYLPPAAAGILVVISMFLTFIAGLIPSGIAARKDPVEALASE